MSLPLASPRYSISTNLFNPFEWSSMETMLLSATFVHRSQTIRCCCFAVDCFVFRSFFFLHKHVLLHLRLFFFRSCLCIVPTHTHGTAVMYLRFVHIHVSTENRKKFELVEKETMLFACANLYDRLECVRYSQNSIRLYLNMLPLLLNAEHCKSSQQ